MRPPRAALLALLIGVLSSPAGAQTYGTPGGSPLGVLGSLQTIPPLPCINVLSGWNDCNSINQWIGRYNQYVGLTNQVVEIQRNVARYATYPQALQSNVQSDLSAIEGIINQANGLAATVATSQARLQALYPAYSPAVSYSTMMAQSSAATQASILNALQTIGYDISTQQRDANTVDVVKAAVANSTSPTQSVQALAQLTAVMVEQLQKQQRITGSAATATSGYYMQRLQQQAAVSAAEASALAHYQQALDVSFPAPTQQQVQQLTSGAP